MFVAEGEDLKMSRLTKLLWVAGFNNTLPVVYKERQANQPVVLFLRSLPRFFKNIFSLKQHTRNMACLINVRALFRPAAKVTAYNLFLICWFCSATSNCLAEKAALFEPLSYYIDSPISLLPFPS